MTAANTSEFLKFWEAHKTEYAGNLSQCQRDFATKYRARAAGVDTVTGNHPAVPAAYVADIGARLGIAYKSAERLAHYFYGKRRPATHSVAESEACDRIMYFVTPDRARARSLLTLHADALYVKYAAGVNVTNVADAARQEGIEQGASDPRLWRDELYKLATDLQNRLTDPPASVATAARQLAPYLKAFSDAISPIPSVRNAAAMKMSPTV